MTRQELIERLTQLRSKINWTSGIIACDQLIADIEANGVELPRGLTCEYMRNIDVDEELGTWVPAHATEDGAVMFFRFDPADVGFFDSIVRGGGTSSTAVSAPDLHWSQLIQLHAAGVEYSADYNPISGWQVRVPSPADRDPRTKEQQK